MRTTRLHLRIIKIEPESHRIGLSLRRVESLAFADMDMKMLEKELEGSDIKVVPEEQEAASEPAEEPVAEESPLPKNPQLRRPRLVSEDVSLKSRKPKAKPKHALKPPQNNLKKIPKRLGNNQTLTFS